MTRDELLGLKAHEIDKNIYASVKEKWDGISKPIDGFGDFEKVIAKLHAINGVASIEKLKKALVIFCGDHGVVAQGVSQTGQEVTASVAKLLGQNKSTASTMAAYAGVDCITVDVGINSTQELEGVINKKVRLGTDDFYVGCAMTEGDCLEAIGVGIEMARDAAKKGYNLLAAGEMGIGNTTSGTAMLCALTGVELEKVLGRGAGLSDEGLARKEKVISEALLKHELIKLRNGVDYTLQIMSKVGGLELCAMTGLFIGAAVEGIPVMIDGVLSAVSALCAARIMPASVDFMIPSHAGREKGTEYVLELLGLTPMLLGNMALGEGTGALMAMPLLDMSLDFLNHATTFKQGNIEQYKRMDTK